MLEEMGDVVDPIRQTRDRPRKRPEKPHADKGYDAEECRKVLRKRSIKSRIARKGKQSSEKPGRHRWVVERKLSWLSHHWGLKGGYERRADIHQAFLDLEYALVAGASRPTILLGTLKMI